MFSLIKGTWNKLFQKPNYKILLIGLDKSGKTCLLNSFKKLLNQKYTPFEKINPTIGLNIATIEMDNSVNTIWDLGGQKQLRKLWQKYILEANAIIYCIDASLDSFKESIEYLVKSIEEQKNEKPLPVLLFLNKLDLIENQEQKVKIVERIKENLREYEGIEKNLQIAMEFCSGIQEENLIDPLIRLNGEMNTRFG